MPELLKQFLLASIAIALWLFIMIAIYMSFD
jgi:uncharacterized membrane-anchored protein